MKENYRTMTISKVTKDDDFLQIIRLIYQTDDYIYPLMCKNDYAYFEKVMLHHLNTKSIFSYQNIIAAKDGEEIIGIVLSFTKGQPLPPLPYKDEFEVRECYSITINNYFHKLISGISSESLYINNVCVDKKHQGLGIGYALIQNTITNSIKNKIVLDCLADNVYAVALYKKCGFKIVDSFLGYSGDSSKPITCLKFEISKSS